MTKLTFRASAKMATGHTIYVWDVYVNSISAGSFVWYHSVPGYSEGFCYGVRNAHHSGVASSARQAVSEITSNCPWAHAGKERF